MHKRTFIAALLAANFTVIDADTLLEKDFDTSMQHIEDGNTDKIMAKPDTKIAANTIFGVAYNSDTKVVYIGKNKQLLKQLGSVQIAHVETIRRGSIHLVLTGEVGKLNDHDNALLAKLVEIGVDYLGSRFSTVFIADTTKSDVNWAGYMLDPVNSSDYGYSTTNLGKVLLTKVIGPTFVLVDQDKQAFGTIDMAKTPLFSGFTGSFDVTEFCDAIGTLPTSTSMVTRKVVTQDSEIALIDGQNVYVYGVSGQTINPVDTLPLPTNAKFMMQAIDIDGTPDADRVTMIWDDDTVTTQPTVALIAQSGGGYNAFLGQAA